jgi:hypothetical protein
MGFGKWIEVIIMGGKGGSSTTVQSYQPTANEDALTGKALEYANAVSPNALRLNDIAGNLLYNSLGDTQVNYNSLLQNALSNIATAQNGVNNLAQGNLPSAYQTNMENSIRSGVQNTLGTQINSLANRGVVNSTVTNNSMKDISDSAANAMAQQYSNNIGTLSQLYGQIADTSQLPITTSAAAQEAQQQPAINLWNASLGLNGATTGALSSIGGKGTTTATSSNSGGSGLFGGILTGLASNAGLFCFSPDTMIDTVNGKREIRNINVGDIVICPDTNGKLKTEKVTQIVSMNKQPIFSICIENNGDVKTIDTTLTQPILLENGEFSEVGNLNIGSKIKGVGIISNMKYLGEGRVYDIEVTGDNNYIANGVIAKGGGIGVWR